MNKLYKKLKTDANTFWGFIFTLICIYLTFDRLIEMLIMIFTGVGSSYWNVITYSLVFLFPFFTFKVMMESKFITYERIKIPLFIFYSSMFGIILMSFFSQLINQGAWLFLLSVPGYEKIAVEDFRAVKAAFTSLALIIPVIMTDNLIVWLRFYIFEDLVVKDALEKMDGFKLSPSKKLKGPYSFESYIALNDKRGDKAYLSEEGRFEHILVVGPTSSGKTSLFVEPMVARDIEKKAFFRDSSKILAFSLLKANIARIKKDVTPEMLDNEFNLNMIEPMPKREKLFNLYLSKVKRNLDPNDLTVKDLGVIYLAPEIESVKKLEQVAQNYGVNHKVVNPDDKDSYGINPFVGNRYESIALTISSMINSMRKATEGSTLVRDNFEESRAVENVVILLKLMYEIKHPEILPTLEDLYKLLSNFDLIHTMAEELKKETSIYKKYEMRFSYIEKHFYADAPLREATEEALETPIAMLETFLTNGKMKTVFCNRTKNIDFGESLENGDVLIFFTERARLSGSLFAMYDLYVNFIVKFLNSGIGKRIPSDKNLIPYFMYWDDYSPFISNSAVEFFSTCRKQRIGVTVTIHNLKQLKDKANVDTYLNALHNRILMPGLTFEEYQFWMKDFGVERMWEGIKSSDDDSSIESMMKEDTKSAKLIWADIMNAGEMNQMKFKSCSYKVKNIKGRYTVGMGALDFVKPEHLSGYKPKYVDFTKLTTSKKNKTIKNKFANKLKTPSLSNHVKVTAEPTKKDYSSDDPIKYN